MLSSNRLSGLIALLLAAFVIGGCSSTATAPVEQQEPVSEPPVAAAPVEEAEEPSDFAGMMVLHPLMRADGRCPEVFTLVMTQPC